MLRDAGRPPRATVAVLGAGAWGSVLASLLSESGHRVRSWSRSGRGIPGGPGGTSDLAAALDGAEVALLVVPNAALSEVLQRIDREAPSPPPGFVSCSKGLIAPGLRRPAGLVAEAFPHRPVAVLSGPNLAAEVADGLPAAATVASHDATFAARVQRLFPAARLRAYTDDDPVGVEVAAAYKNVIALAAGMSDALRLGQNAKASLITRGLAETVRMGTHLGGRERTFYGLAGVGDLVATCTSPASRNRYAGERLALGATVAELERERITAEGLGTVRAVVAEADRIGLPLPIARQVHAVAFEGVPATRAVEALLVRHPRGEWDGRAAP